MYAPMHDKIMGALAKISDKPIRYVVNTHVHGDHTAGNEAMAKLGSVIISHDNMLKRMPTQPAAGLPVLTYTDSLTETANPFGQVVLTGELVGGTLGANVTQLNISYTQSGGAGAGKFGGLGKDVLA